MFKMMTAAEIYQMIKDKKPVFDEKKHCIKLLEIMSDPKKSSMHNFCIEENISESLFYQWLKRNDNFCYFYSLGRLVSRELWEEEGRRISEMELLPGTHNTRYDHWRMVGQLKFGVGRNAKIRLDLNPNDSPDKHYSQLIAQASEGNFSATEIKLLMEAINIGLSTHQTIALQKEINQLKADLITMIENSNGNDSIADQRTTKED